MCTQHTHTPKQNKTNRKPTVSSGAGQRCRRRRRRRPRLVASGATATTINNTPKTHLCQHTLSRSFCRALFQSAQSCRSADRPRLSPGLPAGRLHFDNPPTSTRHPNRLPDSPVSHQSALNAFRVPAGQPARKSGAARVREDTQELIYAASESGKS